MMKKRNGFSLNRREFIKDSVIGLACLPSIDFTSFLEKEKNRKTKIALFKTSNRKQGVQEVLKALDFAPIEGKKVMIKPNFNTADPVPASTHNDTLAQLIQELRGRGAAEITVGERSGPPPTQKVMEDKGIFQLAREMDFKIVNYEELEEKDWVHFNPPGNHWKEGFYIARPAVEAEYFVSTCCLKTHQYGGIFTMSLKLAVGLTPKKLMRELHNSRLDMRKMIAELSLGYKPQLIVLDGVEAFVDGGPSTGTKKRANVFLAGTDLIAVDAVGIAVLKELGSNEAIMGQKIFEQEQIARAVELSLGISGPDQIEFLTLDKPSHKYAEKLKSILAQG
jgi:uncharacterized protein (DUF362 family)